MNRAWSAICRSFLLCRSLINPYYIDLPSVSILQPATRKVAKVMSKRLLRLLREPFVTICFSIIRVHKFIFGRKMMCDVFLFQHAAFFSLSRLSLPKTLWQRRGRVCHNLKGWADERTKQKQ